MHDVVYLLVKILRHLSVELFTFNRNCKFVFLWQNIVQLFYRIIIIQLSGHLSTSISQTIYFIIYLKPCGMWLWIHPRSLRNCGKATVLNEILSLSYAKILSIYGSWFNQISDLLWFRGFSILYLAGPEKHCRTMQPYIFIGLLGIHVVMGK